MPIDLQDVTRLFPALYLGCISNYKKYPIYDLTCWPRDRFIWVVYLRASRRISKMLLMSASSGASGFAATNSVTKPYWITESDDKIRQALTPG